MRHATIWINGCHYPVRNISTTGVKFPDFEELAPLCGTNVVCLVDLDFDTYAVDGKVVRLPGGEVAISPCGYPSEDLTIMVKKWEALR